MPRVRTISFVGAGALASGLATLLHAHGFAIAEIIARPAPSSMRKAKRLARAVGASAVDLETAALLCDVLWLAVPDEAIESVSQVLASRPHLPPVALHPSGSLSSLVLDSLASCGVHTGSAHPMMTFVAGEPPSLKGAWFAVEGSPQAMSAARTMSRKLGANSFAIATAGKALYHAFGTMLSPMLAAELAAAESLGLRAGIDSKDVRKIMEPIVMRTLANVLRNGAGKSFSGPMARGDVQTVASHLAALRGSPESRLYKALVEYAADALPVKRAAEIKTLLNEKAPAPRRKSQK